MLPTYTQRMEDKTIYVEISGDWSKNALAGSKISPSQAFIDAVTGLLDRGGCKRLVLSSQDLEGWDSILLSACLHIAHSARSRGTDIDYSSLPTGMASMLGMALAVPPSGHDHTRIDPGLLELVGSKLLVCPQIIRSITEFIGDIAMSLGRTARGKASCSAKDMWNVFRECGVDALPIVTLTSLLLGLILAFVSSMQLKLFGAEIYIASLVGVSMVRVMGPVLTGIVLSGRTGASFAAVIGSMQVNEEVDALTGFGISPMDFLVLPRVLAMALMTPLLTLYADVTGIGGGFLVGVVMLGISPSAYMENTLEFLTLQQVWVGILHAFVFGIIISICGCYQGIRCGKNASAVGKATTSAVVSSIVGIIVSTSLITIILTYVDL